MPTDSRADAVFSLPDPAPPAPTSWAGIAWAFLAKGFASLRQKPSGQIAAFDGLRSLAILLVVLHHGTEIFLAHGGRFHPVMDSMLVRGGWMGVDLFFVLSGFFIGKLLWTEFRDAGTIDFKRFFLRRGLRIWPLFLTVLVLAALYRVLNGIPLTDIKPELFSYSNYVRGSYIGGSWSLATEEQFYVLVPLLIMAAGLFTRSLRTCLYGLLALFAMAPLARILTWAVIDHSAGTAGERVIHWLYFPIHTHCDGLIAGLILSNVACDIGTPRPWPMRHPAWLLAAGLAAGLLLRHASPVYFNYFAAAVVFGALAWYLLAVPGNWIARALSGRVFFLIAKLSYGMYLLHQPVGHPIAAALTKHLPAMPALLQYAIVLSAMTGGAMIAAAAGYVLVEQPFMRLRSRMESVPRQREARSPALVPGGAVETLSGSMSKNLSPSPLSLTRTLSQEERESPTKDF